MIQLSSGWRTNQTMIHLIEQWLGHGGEAPTLPGDEENVAIGTIYDTIIGTRCCCKFWHWYCCYKIIILRRHKQQVKKDKDEN